MKDHSDLEAQLRTSRKELSLAQATMNAAIDAQIVGSKAGLTLSIYEPRLKEAAARLEKAKAQVATLEAQSSAHGIVPGQSAREAAAQQAEAIRQALSGFENDLFDEELPVHAKNHILARIIERIVPSADYTVQIFPRLF